MAGTSAEPTGEGQYGVGHTRSGHSCTVSQSYGRPRVVRTLHEQGISVGHERVRQSLLRQTLRPVYRKPYRVTTDSAHTKPIAANVLDRRFEGWAINRAWVADLTYIATEEGWLYLACVLDLGSRRVVGWSMSERMKAKLVCDALTMALSQCALGSSVAEMKRTPFRFLPAIVHQS